MNELREGVSETVYDAMLRGAVLGKAMIIAVGEARPFADRIFAEIIRKVEGIENSKAEAAFDECRNLVLALLEGGSKDGS